MLAIIDKNSAYKSFEMTTNGKVRNIDAIDSKSSLYKLQRNFLDRFLIDIPLPDCVCGCVKGKCYLDFLIPHCGKKYYLRLDIKDFFNSLKVDKIRSVLDEYIQVSDLNKKNLILDDIGVMVTLNDSLPQGAITSPQISNILFRRIDIRIRNYCRKFDVEYTRYADDLLFSSNKSKLHDKFFTKMIFKIIKDFDLVVNRKKIRKSEERLVLNGYVIDKNISLSRAKLKNINTLLYCVEYNSGTKAYPRTIIEFFDRLKNVKTCLRLTSDIKKNKSIVINYFAGYRAFLINFSKIGYKDYCKDYTTKIDRIEKALEIIQEIK